MKGSLIFADNFDALQYLKKDFSAEAPACAGRERLGRREKIRLIYIDPPYGTKQLLQFRTIALPPLAGRIMAKSLITTSLPEKTICNSSRNG